MRSKIFVLSILIILIFSCKGKTKVTEDLKIDFQANVAAEDAGNYFTFKGPIRLIEADKDKPDSKTGASAKGSSKLFQAYKYDVKGKLTFPDGLRGLFLYAVNPYKQMQTDNFTVSKAADGVITIQFAHRGTAYIITTDKNGKMLINENTFKKRTIGYIKGDDPQVIHKDFSEDGSAAKIEWGKVWDKNIAGDKEISAVIKNKTGNTVGDVPEKDAMYYWEGSLQAVLDNNILKVSGAFGALKK